MSDSSSGSERRKYHRIATDQVISFAEVDRPEQLAVSKNLSSGGISFEAVGIEIDLGDVLRVTFNVADQTVVATGTVVWATDTDPITQEVGIQFHEIDPEAARLLEEFIEPALEPVGLY
ncbi:MAG: PilZ domain-containing protein [Myxococcota bacterium]